MPHIRLFEDDEGEEQPREWEAVPFDLTKRIVCAECNGGWMSRLESDVKPLIAPAILGEQTTFDIEQQGLVATWAVKTALMLEHTHPRGQLTMPTVAYDYLYRHRLPPPNECVFLLRYEGEDQWPLSYHHFGIKFARPSDPLPAEANGHGIVFAVGYLGVHLFGHHIEENPQIRCTSSDHAACIGPATDAQPSGRPRTATKRLMNSERSRERGRANRSVGPGALARCLPGRRQDLR